MRSGTRVVLLALAAVVAVVGFVLVKPDEGSNEQTEAPAEQPRATTTTTTGQPEQPPPPPPVSSVRVRDGEPVGGVQELEFDKGETVEFFVTSDVADHVHVHGYDLMKDVTPGKRVKFEFEADIDGQFEVELEDRHVQIATLRVNP